MVGIRLRHRVAPMRYQRGGPVPVWAGRRPGGVVRFRGGERVTADPQPEGAAMKAALPVRFNYKGM